MNLLRVIDLFEKDSIIPFGEFESVLVFTDHSIAVKSESGVFKLIERNDGVLFIGDKIDRTDITIEHKLNKGIDSFIHMLDMIKYNKLDLKFVSVEDNYFGDDYVFCITDDVSDYIVYMAHKYLITECGGCNWGNIEYLRSKGYPVLLGEKDSFGWLTGCIYIKNEDTKFKTVFVYG